jgi:hypothetical protein
MVGANARAEISATSAAIGNDLLVIADIINNN